MIEELGDMSPYQLAATAALLLFCAFWRMLVAFARSAVILRSCLHGLF